MPPGLVLNKLDLYFSATGLLILGPTLVLVLVVATAVDGIVVLDEGVVADGRDAVVPGVGTRTLILSRRGCDGIRHVVMEDEKGKSNKVSKERRSTRGVPAKKRVKDGRGPPGSAAVTSRSAAASGGGREGGGGRGGRGEGSSEGDGMAWASFLERETVPCWETTTKLGEKKNRRSI